jgi:hypothetical protein
VIVVVLPAVLGAVTTTDMSWLIESDVPVCGTGLVTLTIVQAELELFAVIVNEAAYIGESLYVKR